MTMLSSIRISSFVLFRIVSQVRDTDTNNLGGDNDGNSGSSSSFT